MARKFRLPKLFRKPFRLRRTKGNGRRSDPKSPPPMLSVGSKLPDQTVDMVLATTGQGELVMTRVPISEAVLGTNKGSGGSSTSRSILVVMPAAATKSCASIHLPGYNTDIAARLQELGVNKIAILLTSDKFVNQARTDEDSCMLTTTAPSSNTERTPLTQDSGTSASCCSVTILIDSNGDLLEQLGVTRDMGFGVRTNRMVVILDNHGLVQQVLREENVKDCTATSAERLVDFLNKSSSSSSSDNTHSWLLAANEEDGEDDEAIEIDFRLVIFIGALVNIALFEVLSRFLADQGWHINLFPFHIGKTARPESIFQLLKDHL